MTLPAAFPLSMSQIANELGRSLPLGMLDPMVLALAQKSGPPISMSDLLSKTGRFDGSVATQGSDATILSLAIAAPWFGGQTSAVNQVRNFQTLQWSVNLAFSVAPNWTGNIVLKNNTAGTSIVMSKSDATLWVIPEPLASSPNVLRLGATDSFSILPHG